MATMREIAKLIESLFPPENVCMDDSIGLMVGSLNTESSRALVCLDCTMSVLDEAISKGIKIIITHHPLIFRGISSITDLTPTGRIILKAANAGIAVFSAHTNMDCSAGGINEYAAELLELSDVEPLTVINDNAALGLVGNLNKKHTIESLTEKVSEVFFDKYAKPYGNAREIKRVAVINGAGGDIEFIDSAIKKGADCLITAEIKHHVALYAVENSFALIEFGHYASEHVYIPRLCKILNKKASEINLEIQFIEAENESNPVR